MDIMLPALFAASLNYTAVALPDNLPSHQSYVMSEAVCYYALNENVVATPTCRIPIKDWRVIEEITLARARARNCDCKLDENLLQTCQ